MAAGDTVVGDTVVGVMAAGVVGVGAVSASTPRPIAMVITLHTRTITTPPTPTLMAALPDIRTGIADHTTRVGTSMRPTGIATTGSAVVVTKSMLRSAEH